jgi:hypothetical protein
MVVMKVKEKREKEEMRNNAPHWTRICHLSCPMIRPVRPLEAAPERVLSYPPRRRMLSWKKEMYHGRKWRKTAVRLATRPPKVRKLRHWLRYLSCRRSCAPGPSRGKGRRPVDPSQEKGKTTKKGWMLMKVEGHLHLLPVYSQVALAITMALTVVSMLHRMMMGKMMMAYWTVTSSRPRLVDDRGRVGSRELAWRPELPLPAGEIGTNQ